MQQQRHILDVDDLGRDEIDTLLEQAARFKHGEKAPRRLGSAIGLLFEEPSVRTRFGFSTAAARIGAAAIEVPAPYLEPAMSDRETLADLVRSVGSYVDVLVTRCASIEALQTIAAHADVPVINAGAANHAHPTQALIDIFAMMQRFGRVDGLHIGIMGDLASSRCAKSLMRLLARYEPAEVRLMHPGKQALSLAEMHVPVPTGHPTQWNDLGAQRDLGGLDVIYMAGLPAGLPAARQDPAQVELRQRLSVDRTAVAQLPEGGVILCPMPRIDEIGHDLDEHTAMGMFEQSRDGLYVRCAVLQLVARA